MGPRFNDPAVLKHDYSIRVAHGVEVVRDDDGRAAFHQAFEGSHHPPRRGGVEAGGWFVEDQDGRVPDRGPRHGDALALAAGEEPPFLSDPGVVPFG